ncbi:SDR family oxidoreductase [Nocardia sp. NPDC051570]|uniref:SDR family oxidoreductase n=1 Tax=Nocardia sp. NPDC051570 TaxID=3364324 RepID=UPI0037B79788
MLGLDPHPDLPGTFEHRSNEPDRPLLELLASGVPSRRLSQVEEIAAAAVFLAGDESTNMHGTTIPVDGGMTAALWLRGTPTE